MSHYMTSVFLWPVLRTRCESLVIWFQTSFAIWVAFHHLIAWFSQKIHRWVTSLNQSRHVMADCCTIIFIVEVISDDPGKDFKIFFTFTISSPLHLFVLCPSLNLFIFLRGYLPFICFSSSVHLCLLIPLRLCPLPPPLPNSEAMISKQR